MTGDKLPVTLGHEFCGRVKEAPSGSKFKTGQAVVCDPRLYCRSCNSCGIQQTVDCEKWGFRGLSGGGGGFSQFVSVHESQIYAIPDELLPYGALVEPLAVAWHAIKRAPTQEFSNKTALVLGGGPIGIALVLVLKAFGASCVIVSEPTEARRKQNQDLAHHVLNPLEQKIGDECRKLTNGQGVDYVFDAAGVPVGMNAGVDALKFHAWYINVAGWEEPVRSNVLCRPCTLADHRCLLQMPSQMVGLFMKEFYMTCSRAYNDQDFAETVEYFVQGKFPGFEKMVTSRIGLQDITDKGFKQLIENKDQHIKILVTPQEALLA